MNIHITDRNLFEKLLKSSFIKIEIGSKMYGLEHENSDTDLLCIYNTSDLELKSMFMSHHQLQYKENNIDYIFVNIHTFIRNTLSGDSTINFEVINSNKLIGAELEFFYTNRKYFSNYKIIRSYLGLARRDLKRINIDAKSEFDKNKKIAHAYRGLNFARNIVNGNTLFFSKIELVYIKTNIWTLKGHEEREKYTNSLMKEIEEFRKIVNTYYDNGKFVSFMAEEGQKIINEKLYDLLNNSKTKQMENFDMNYYYNANENDVKY